MMDIDNFKLYNDSYGHQQGDVALKMVANAITAALKRSADMAFRRGGEEFAALLTTTKHEGAVQIAEQIRKSVEDTVIPDIIKGEQHSVTVSIGVASVFPEIGMKIDDLIRQADMALYDAKKTGRNKVCSIFIG